MIFHKCVVVLQRIEDWFFFPLSALQGACWCKNGPSWGTASTRSMGTRATRCTLISTQLTTGIGPRRWGLPGAPTNLSWAPGKRNKKKIVKTSLIYLFNIHTPKTGKWSLLVVNLWQFFWLSILIIHFWKVEINDWSHKLQIWIKDWPTVLLCEHPTLDLWLEITKSGKFVIQGFIWITKF